MKLLLSTFFRGMLILWERYVRYVYIFRKRSKYIQIGVPINVNPDFVKIDKYTRIQPDVKFISAGVPITIKKFTAIGAGCLIIPGTHIPTVGLPQYLSTLHVNDKGHGITINEDCWIGAESALLSNCNIGRGCVVGARATVTKDIPPYAVVAGVPAKIIATRFTLEQIIKHEKILYPENERLQEDFLHKLFNDFYKDLKSIGTSEISDKDLNFINHEKRKVGIKIYS